MLQTQIEFCALCHKDTIHMNKGQDSKNPRLEIWECIECHHTFYKSWLNIKLSNKKDLFL